MKLFVFVQFHAVAGREDALAALLREALAPSRAEPGCLAIDAYRSTRNPRLFFIHSRWTDEAAFDLHAELPHTRQFLRDVQPLLEAPPEVVRTRPVE